MMKFMKKKNKRNSMIVTSLSETSDNSEIKSRNSLDLSKIQYENSIYSKISSEDHNNKLIDLYKDNIEIKKNKKNIICEYCNEYGDGNFIILNCNHVFHIICLANEHFEDSKINIIDENFFNKRKCLICYQQLELEDVQLIHNKYHKHTKQYIKQQQDRILNLDSQMNKIKEELRVCYVFKEKLEKEKEKSTQIIITINTLI